MSLNKDEIRRFFEFLDPQAQYFTVCLLDSESKKPISGYGTMFDTVPVILATLDQLEEVKPTLHVTLNAMNDKGRRKENVMSTRVLCVDIDEPISVAKLQDIWSTYNPHHVVCSSKVNELDEEGNFKGKYHFYWKIEGIPFETWQHYQLSLAHHFNGDMSFDTLTKTVRVPGVSRLCKDGTEYTPMVIGVSEEKDLSLEDLHKVFPWHEKAYSEALEARKEESKRLKQEFKRFEKKGGQIDVSKSGRNNALWHQTYKHILDNFKASELSEEDKESISTYADSVNEAFSEDCGGPLSASEVEKTVDSATRAASDKKEKQIKVDKALLEHLEVVAATPTNGDGGLFEYDYSKGALAEDRFSTLSTVERVVQRYSEHMCLIGGELYAFCPETKVWKPQKPRNSLIGKFVQTCTRDILRDPTFIVAHPGEKARNAITKFYSHNFLSGVKNQVLDYNGIVSRDATDFDCNESMVYCLNGVLDMHTGTLREATMGDYLLGRNKIVYDPQARCPDWLKFLSEVFSDNTDGAEMIAFLQRLFGYSLTSSIAAQKVFVHSGGGSNGKSKVLQALSLISGSYGTMMSGSTFAATPNALAKEMERVAVKIEGKRVVVMDDMDSKTKWNEGLVKHLTGPLLPARKLYAEEKDIPNRAKFHLGCNDRPVPQSENFGILRRICILPYSRQFEPIASKETELNEMIRRELAGIFNWALEGYRLMIEMGGICEPNEVVESLEEYRAEHFTADALVERLFKKISPDVEPEWHGADELLEYVNGELEAHGMSDKKLIKNTLGTFLKSHLKCESRRTTVNGQKITQYNVEVVKTEKKDKFGLDGLN